MNSPHEHHTPTLNGHKALVGVEALDNLNYADPLDYEMAGTTRASNDEKIAGILEQQNVLLLRMDSRLSAADEKKPNFTSTWGPAILALILVIAGWIFNGLYIAKSTEAEIRVANAVTEEKLKQIESAFSEFKHNAEVDRKVSDERLRQMSIVLEARGIRLPNH